jgi:hypothetical protein
MWGVHIGNILRNQFHALSTQTQCPFMNAKTCIQNAHIKPIKVFFLSADCLTVGKHLSPTQVMQNRCQVTRQCRI